MSPQAAVLLLAALCLVDRAGADIPGTLSAALLDTSNRRSQIMRRNSFGATGQPGKVATAQAGLAPNEAGEVAATKQAASAQQPATSAASVVQLAAAVQQTQLPAVQPASAVQQGTAVQQTQVPAEEPAEEPAVPAAPTEAAPNTMVVEGAKIAPFGKEDTAAELQNHAARTQDTLVDAVENAEVAEIKRAVFRSLTRLRAASIKEFDTIARLETQSIDEYNDAHHYRTENPLEYLHNEEPQVAEDKFTAFH